MKKQPKVEYGITITKPWSAEMYAHNEEVANVVREKVSDMWRNALSQYEESLELVDEEDGYEIGMLALEWDRSCVSDEMNDIQRAVTVHGFGSGYTIDMVASRVEQELEVAPFYRLNEIAEELDIKLEKNFIGLNK